MPFRNLTTHEIVQLQNQGCSSGDWNNVRVDDMFKVELYRFTELYGECFLEGVDDEYTTAGQYGVYFSKIDSCHLGRNCSIRNSSIFNYDIDDNVVIENVQELKVDGLSYFGNKVELKVLNEAGGRELRIFNDLTSNLAHYLVFYRHSIEIIRKLNNCIDIFAEELSSDRGFIGHSAEMKNCSNILNVRIEPYAKINGVLKLKNGSVCSNVSHPSYVGHGVIAEDFVFQSGVKIDTGAQLFGVFAGQAVELARQFTAENSAFFANSQFYNGECCSAYCGPYSVSHHKSTLLIAVACSFFNAGSNTNQSNHMYKTGPVHQGVFERGTKTGSGSYVLLPAKTGPFTFIGGKHYSNPDIGDLPFSYLIEKQGKSYCYPGNNLKTSGTFRDTRKWPKRDKRKDPEKKDIIIFDPENPFVIAKCLKAWQILTKLRLEHVDEKEIVFGNTIIPMSAVKRGIENYMQAMQRFIGNRMYKMATENKLQSLDEIRNYLLGFKNEETEQWKDFSGLVLPESEIDNFERVVKDGSRLETSHVLSFFKESQKKYEINCNRFLYRIINVLYDKLPEHLNTEDYISILTDYGEAASSVFKTILKDGGREFTGISLISYGEGGLRNHKTDFESVRGSLAESDLSKQVEKEIEVLNNKKDTLLTIIKN